MLRCIEIAQNGLGSTAPNPMVGAVIVHNCKIIGEGFTSAYGGSHAEVNAIQSVTDKALLKEATLYVTLEPCSHYGKTPPCADLITASQIANVVIGILDPHTKVAGQGIQKLKDAGCQVTVGILEEECREHHKRFLTFHQKKRPYIILKWAETQDGFIAPDSEERKVNPQPFWITNKTSRQLVHQWRAEEQAILVGTNTAIEDNPKLDVRQWKGKNPLRVILDRSLKIGKEAHVFDGSTPTLVITEQEATTKYVKGIHYEIIDFSKPLAKQICNVLFKHNITSLIVEGGAQTLQNFIGENLWDEARVFIGATYFTKGIKAPELNGKLISNRTINKDQINSFKP